MKGSVRSPARPALDAARAPAFSAAAWCRSLGWERSVLVLLLVLLDSALIQNLTRATDVTDPTSSPAAQATWFLVYGYALVWLAIERKKTRSLLIATLPIALVVGMTLLSTLWSVNPDLTFKRALGLAGTTMVGYYIVCRLTLKQFVECLVTSTGIAAVLSVLAIVFLKQIGIMQDEYAGAWDGVYGHKNQLASAMVVGVVSAYTLIKVSQGRQRAIYIALLALFSVLLIGSRSATSLLVALFMVAIMSLAGLVRKPRVAGPFLLVLGTVLGAVTIMCLAVGVRGDVFFDALGRDSSLTGRVDIWPTVIKAIGDKPWLGWGYKAFWVVDGPVSNYIFGDWIPPHAHNGFLEMSLDIGIVGTGMFIIGWLLSVWHAARYWVQYGANALAIWPIASMILLVLSNVTEANIAMYNSVAWAVFVAAVAYVSPVPFAKREREEKRITNDRSTRRRIRPYRMPGSQRPSMSRFKS